MGRKALVTGGDSGMGRVGSNLDSISSVRRRQKHFMHFGETYPLRRAGQPAELASIYVQLTANDASYKLYDGGTSMEPEVGPVSQ